MKRDFQPCMAIGPKTGKCCMLRRNHDCEVHMAIDRYGFTFEEWPRRQRTSRKTQERKGAE